MRMRVHSKALAVALLMLLVVLPRAGAQRIVPVPRAETEQRPITLMAVMILASDRPAPIDERIENIEFKLRRIFKFEHYLYYGKGSLTLTLPGSGTIRLGKGYRLDISASRTHDKKIRAKVKWRGNGRVLLSTTTVVGRGTPTVLGGVSHEDGKLIVTMVAK